MKTFLIAIAAMSIGFMQPISAAVTNPIKHLEPSNWWTGMHNPNLQLLVHANNISNTSVSINYNGVTVRSVEKVENPNYLFINLTLADNVKPGAFDIVFSNGKKIVAKYNYQLKARAEGSAQRQGFSSEDAMYLIMPDRFANGKTDNDNMPGMIEQMDRKAPYGRHGGDLNGIEQHLDYISNLGMTAIWLNPVQENNMESSSYHGYAITNYYEVDARLGTLDEYKQLVDESHKHGIKMIMDMVFNHCGTNHWWMKDLPMTNWINQWPNDTRSNFRLSTVSDPHVSKHDLDITTKGWFDSSMADMNMANPYVATYMIQNSIWWIETVGLDGIRQDTYPYPDKNGMAQWQTRLAEEYPNFNTVGEVWITESSKLCYWQKDFPSKEGFNSQLPSLMDFPMHTAIRNAFTEEPNWDHGMMRLYNALADDYLYPNTNNLVVFGENHDAGRLLFFLNNDAKNLKLALAFIATVRGIPQLYYGTEILMTGNGEAGHANIREDFPGGWDNDNVNAFAKNGRTAEQNDIVDYMQKLFNYRKNSPAIKHGDLTHFIPQNEVYVYFRTLNEKTVMVVLNNNKEQQELPCQNFAEILSNYNSGHDIISNKDITSLNNITVDGKTAMIIELK